MYSKSHFYKNKNILSLVFSHLLIFTLLFTLFYDLQHGMFSFLDRLSFRFLNGWIQTSTLWQNFWAMANHRMADWVEDGIFILFFFWIFQSTKKELRIRKLAEILFFIVYASFIILVTNELLFRVLLHIKRDSPTLVMENFTNLSEKITWLKVKFRSPKSFPGDHATTALLFIASFRYLAKDRRIIRYSAFAYGIFLCLPRLIAGAHWLSDILVGSGSIVMLFFAWAFYTPLGETCIKKIEHGLLCLKKKSLAR